LPREDRELFIAASNGHVLAFDNVSVLKPWISDTLCRLASGGGFAVRQLYSDQDEILFDACRPMILNGIEEIVERPDLADRGLSFLLESIPEDRRRTEEELLLQFETERPRILGALLDGVSEGLRRLPDVHSDKLPRLADYALGRPPVRLRSGPLARSSRLIGTIATKPLTMFSTPTPSPLACASSWRSSRAGRAPPRISLAPSRASWTKPRGGPGRGPRHPEHYQDGSAGQ
jgi:hypothetical protein